MQNVLFSGKFSNIPLHNGSGVRPNHLTTETLLQVVTDVAKRNFVEAKVDFFARTRRVDIADGERVSTTKNYGTKEFATVTFSDNHRHKDVDSADQEFIRVMTHEHDQAMYGDWTHHKNSRGFTPKSSVDLLLAGK